MWHATADVPPLGACVCSSLSVTSSLFLAVSVSAVQSSSVQFSSVAKLFKWQLNSHKMKTRCLHCSYNFWSFLWHLKWLLDKGLTNGYCRISLACVAHFIASVVAYYFSQLAKTSNRLIKGVHTDTDFFPPKTKKNVITTPQRTIHLLGRKINKCKFIFIVNI